MNCEEEMRCVCVCVCVWWGVGRRKKKSRGLHEWWGKKREIKRKKEMGSGVYVYGGKKWEVEKKEEKKIKSEKTKLVLFVYLLCLVQNVKL